MSGPHHALTHLRLQPEQVMQLLQMLAPERAEALTLRIFSGLDVAEIAHIMGKSDTEAKMLVLRAVHDLHAQIALGSEEQR